MASLRRQKFGELHDGRDAQDFNHSSALRPDMQGFKEVLPQPSTHWRMLRMHEVILLVTKTYYSLVHKAGLLRRDVSTSSWSTMFVNLPSWYSLE